MVWGSVTSNCKGSEPRLTARDMYLGIPDSTRSYVVIASYRPLSPTLRPKSFSGPFFLYIFLHFFRLFDKS